MYKFLFECLFSILWGIPENTFFFFLRTHFLRDILHIFPPRKLYTFLYPFTCRRVATMSPVGHFCTYFLGGNSISHNLEQYSNYDSQYPLPSKDYSSLRNSMNPSPIVLSSSPHPLIPKHSISHFYFNI